MTERAYHSRKAFVLALCVASGLTLSNAACSSDNAGGLSPQAGSVGNGDNTDPSSGGSGSAGDSGTGNAGSSVGAATGSAGTGAAGDTSAGGTTGSAGSVGTTACVFHTDPPTDIVGGVAGAAGDGSGGVAGTTGAAGAGGAAEPVYDVVAESISGVGENLADKDGFTLYTYGNDLPGDCNEAPVSNCLNDCLKQWPVFDAGARVLDPKLSDGVFGRFQRSDGLWQTTFHGWPLYYYVDKSGNVDAANAGQGRGKTWHIAETVTPTVMIMKQSGKDGIRYLADWKGRTLYTFEQDTKGTDDAYPVSACTGDCIANFPGLMERRFSAVPSLEAADFGVFVRDNAALQMSYKGAPLYYARSDVKAGTFTGTATAGFAVAVP